MILSKLPGCGVSQSLPSVDPRSLLPLIFTPPSLVILTLFSLFTNFIVFLLSPTQRLQSVRLTMESRNQNHALRLFAESTFGQGIVQVSVSALA